jgi:hypothetical protein
MDIYLAPFASHGQVSKFCMGERELDMFLLCKMSGETTTVYV